MSAARRCIATTERQHNEGRNIAVIGGGIGGLTAALAFARKGAVVTVYEQADALTEVGAGIQITPNGARVLHRLMLGEALEAIGLQAQAAIPMDGVKGRPITRFDLRRQSPPYRFCHRAALIDLFARACAANGVTLRLGTRVERFSPDGAFVADGDKVTADLTIGADGIKSVVRSQFNKPDDPFFTGQVAWRAMIRQPDAAPEARIWMLPGRHLVSYPLPNGQLNVVAVQQRSQWAQEGWHHEDEPGNLRAAFADASWEIKTILGAVEHCNLWGLFRHPVAPNWRMGSTVILGDAAHPTLPFLAQGANLAIEDAYVLARCCNESSSIDTALQRYQEIRRPRVIRAIAAANANATNYHLTGLRRVAAHTGLRMLGALAPDAFLKRLSWLYDHDVTA